MRRGRRGGSVFGAMVLSIAAAACTGSIGFPGGNEDRDRNPGAPGAPGAGGAPAAPQGPFVAHESVARRLSRAEIDNTVRDFLGDDSAPASRFLAEDEFSPYDNDYSLQQASQALIDSIEAMATDVAGRVIADPALRDLAVPCTPAGDGDEACFRTTVEHLARRAFRRPVTTEDVDAYAGLLAFATEENPYVDNDFYTAVELALRAMLQDPEFLYRIEVGAETDVPGVFALDSYEVASRLSFLLWGSTPDEQLSAAAEDGALTDPEERRAHAERLLADDRAKRQIHRFHAMWLGYRAIPHPPELTAAFNRETTALLDRVVFGDGGSYLELFDSPETYLDEALADHYGLPRPEGGAGWVPYGDTGRAGILSHGSVLAAFSKFSDTSPTQRGILVRTRLLCQPLRPPPANVDVDQPPGDDDSLCKYDRYEEHRVSSSCRSCHGEMDPIGFGLENYDIAGRYRTHDEGLPECVISGEGELPGFGTFNGPKELGEKLIESGELDDCVVRQYLSFAVGRALGAAEAPRVAELTTGFTESDRAFRALILDLVASEPFALRKEPTP